MLTRDMPISSRTTDAEDDELVELVDPDVAVSTGCIPSCVSLLFLGRGNRSGLASRSAFSRSRSTISIGRCLLISSQMFSMRSIGLCRWKLEDGMEK